MELEPEARAILEGRHVAILATLVRGGPATAAVWYALDGDDVIVSTPAGKRKANNVRDDPRVSLLVDVRDSPHVPGALAYKGVEVRGVARLQEDPGATLRRAIVARYLDPIPPEFEARIIEGERTIIRIEASKVRIWDFSRGR
ncbi:MAG: TIGR03618 family F420-dependent PPOX class oxidoreductase [Chloroflexi bacterium]|nr:TIGR03618 family F420-dependent PPOX class oxidoreductase [Chloroflexota bacterium]